jgi:hypothetical protein
MKQIETNNKGTLVFTPEKNGITVIKYDHNHIAEYSDFIHDKDLVMLFNYWKNCKNGLKKSSYIR